MSKLFVRLVNEGLYEEWASLLDWLFDETRFKGWGPGYIGALTKKIKKLPRIGEKTYFYGCAKNMHFPEIVKEKSLMIMMTKHDCEAKDLIRHIRNGIAHGNTQIHRIEGELYIEIIDCSKNGKQTAYICIPINYINQVYKLYQEVKKSSENKRNIQKRK